MSDTGDPTREGAHTQPNRDKVEAIRRYIRSEGKAFLTDPNITSIGIGYKIKDGRPTDELSVQFTVRQKGQPDAVPEGLGTEPIPKTIKIGAEEVPTDVIERQYEPSWTEVEAEETDPRKLRQNPMFPGISICHTSGTAGTLGLIVVDRATGEPCTLSNWHVLHGSQGVIGDPVVQPGPHDDNNLAGNAYGTLLRSHLGEAGDCAVASISERDVKTNIHEFGVTPSQIVRVELGDRVIKSGRTTGVTVGVVRRVDVIVKMPYEGLDEPVPIGGFEIGSPPGAPADYEVSMGGDSGSAWMIADGDDATDRLAGLHFAGEAGGSTDEHALACYAHSVFKKLDIELTSSSAAAVEQGREPEWVGRGYEPDFLPGDTILPPTLSADLEPDAVKLPGGGPLIPYTHFSVCLSKSRGFARFVAWNIDGARIKRLSRSHLDFEKDDHVPPECQHGNELYEHNNLDRGHIARRADLCWGTDAAAERANEQSFLYTNILPQHAAFNQSRRYGIWGRLEDAIFADVEVADLRVSLFGGPVFGADDPVYRDVPIPRDFWKVLVYRDNTDATTKLRAYILTQRKLLSDIEALELDEFNLFQIPLDRLKDETGLDFSLLAALDTFAPPVGPEAVDVAKYRARPVRTSEQLFA